MALRPLKNSFLFAFFNDTAQGLFFERNKGKIILTNKDWDSMGQFARWGRVLAVGPQVTDFNVGEIVLIEAGKWTIGFEHEGVRIWKSDQEKVIAIGEDESVTFAYSY
jgi:hypothetical protein